MFTARIVMCTYRVNRQFEFHVDWYFLSNWYFWYLATVAMVVAVWQQKFKYFNTSKAQIGSKNLLILIYSEPRTTQLTSSHTLLHWKWMTSGLLFVIDSEKAVLFVFAQTTKKYSHNFVPEWISIFNELGWINKSMPQCLKNNVATYCHNNVNCRKSHRSENT